MHFFSFSPEADNEKTDVRTPSLYSVHLRSSADSGQAREYKEMTAVACLALNFIREPGYPSSRHLFFVFFSIGMYLWKMILIEWPHSHLSHVCSATDPD